MTIMARSAMLISAILIGGCGGEPPAPQPSPEPRAEQPAEARPRDPVAPPERSSSPQEAGDGASASVPRAVWTVLDRNIRQRVPLP